MRRRLSSKRTSGSRPSRYVQPRLEALEDRLLPSGNPLGASYTTTITPVHFIPRQELILPDGKILLGQTISIFDPTTGQDKTLPMQYNGPAPPWFNSGKTQVANAILLARLNADGTLDTTFGNGGMETLQPDLSDTFANFAVAPDGSIIIEGTEVSSGAGYFLQSNYWNDFVWQDSGVRLLRLNADGSVDSSFQAGNVSGFRVDTAGLDSIGGLAIQADGKIVVAGEQNLGSPTIFVARYNTDGSFDTTFNPGGAQPGVTTTSFANSLDPGYGGISTVLIQGDGKIVVGGSQVVAGGMVVLRYNTDGSADAGFGTDGMVSFGVFGNLAGLAIQSDGKIVAEGLVSPNGANAQLELVRLNTDGTFDNSFGQQGIVETNLAVWGGGLIVQANGKIVVAGDAVSLARQGFVAQFNPDGSPDSTFGPGGVQYLNSVYFGPGFVTVDPLGVGVAPDGSILVVSFQLPNVVLLDFQENTTGGAVATPAVAAPPAPNTLSDVVFQLLASEQTPATAGPPGIAAAGNFFGLPGALPATITPLPIPGESQSEVVARMSGGGGIANAIDDPFALTGEPDRIGDLVLAGEVDVPGL